MKPIPNKGRVLARSYAMLCVYGGIAAQLAPEIIPYLDGYIPRWLSVVLLLASIPARVIDQGGLHNGK